MATRVEVPEYEMHEVGPGGPREDGPGRREYAERLRQGGGALVVPDAEETIPEIRTSSRSPESPG